MVAALYFYYGPPGSGKSQAIAQRVQREHTEYNPVHFCRPMHGRPARLLRDGRITDIVFHDAPCIDCVWYALIFGKDVHVETNQDPRPWINEWSSVLGDGFVCGIQEFQAQPAQ